MCVELKQLQNTRTSNLFFFFFLLVTTIDETSWIDINIPTVEMADPMLQEVKWLV